jgi:CRISPR-associated exonuclease Cas4
MEGNILHDRTDEPETEVRGELRIARALRLRSLRLGLSGKADVVEFHCIHETVEPAGEEKGMGAGIRMEGVSGWWKPFPVEYKRGSPKTGRWDEIQLCAQGLCMEEMLGVSVPEGALFYGKPRRRQGVVFDRVLREATEELAGHLHELTREGVTPPAIYEKKCESCSIQSFCLPKVTGKRRSTRRYIDTLFTLSEDERGDGKP